MMYCGNQDCPLERVFDGGSHGFRCPACGQSLVMTDRQLLRGALVSLLLGVFGALVCAGVLSDTSWRELVTAGRPLAAATLTVTALAGVAGFLVGAVQLTMWRRERKSLQDAAELEQGGAGKGA